MVYTLEHFGRIIDFFIGAPTGTFPVILDVQHRCVKFKYIVAGDGTYQNARLSVQKRTLLTRFSDELFSVQGRTSSSWSSEAVDVQSFADYQVNSYVIEVVSPVDSQNTV